MVINNGILAAITQDEFVLDSTSDLGSGNEDLEVVKTVHPANPQKTNSADNSDDSSSTILSSQSNNTKGLQSSTHLSVKSLNQTMIQLQILHLFNQVPKLCILHHT